MYQEKNRRQMWNGTKKITNIIQNLFQFHFHIIANKDFNFTPQPGLIWMPSLSFFRTKWIHWQILERIIFSKIKKHLNYSLCCWPRNKNTDSSRTTVICVHKLLCCILCVHTMYCCICLETLSSQDK